jgi:cold shock CspA family protein
MRFDGTLKTWNDERGFGFITPRQNGEEIFVHISAFPRDGLRPTLEEPLSFEIKLNHEGKKRAVNVHRPVRPKSAISPRPHNQPSLPRLSLLRGAIWVTILVSLGAYGYTEYSRRSNLLRNNQDGESAAVVAEQISPQRALDVRCDGRNYCSQMTSCAEAKFFLKNCPGVQMDGNFDGVPCEQQWCTSPFSK